MKAMKGPPQTVATLWAGVVKTQRGLSKGNKLKKTARHGEKKTPVPYKVRLFFGENLMQASCTNALDKGDLWGTSTSSTSQRKKTGKTLHV